MPTKKSPKNKTAPAAPVQQQVKSPSDRITHKWWFWVLLVLLVIIIITVGGCGACIYFTSKTATLYNDVNAMLMNVNGQL